MKTALIAGATGLIGSQLTRLLTASKEYDSVIAVSRKPLAFMHPKLRSLLVDFDKLEERQEELKCDHVFCCLGTTMKQAGSKEAFRKVDYEYPLRLARTARQAGATTFLIVSAMGANRKSAIFYNRIKGEIQDEVSRVDYPSLHILQPGLLSGPRSGSRPGERWAGAVMKTLAFLIPKRMRVIESIKVARAMVTIAQRDEKGIFFHDSAELQGY